MVNSAVGPPARSCVTVRSLAASRATPIIPSRTHFVSRCTRICCIPWRRDQARRVSYRDYSASGCGLRTSAVGGLRDRALLGVMIYSFARVSAVVNMNVEDYYQTASRFLIRLDRL